jgi:hypothetical protein
MKSVALALGFWLLLGSCLSCGTAGAQTSECQYVAKANDRLACYDRANPPLSRGKTKPAERYQAPSPQGDQGDVLATENARLDSKINNICRGC